MRGAIIVVVATLGSGLPARAQDPPGTPAADPCSPRAAPIPLPPMVPDDSLPAALYAPLRGLDTAHPLGVGHLYAEGDADWIGWIRWRDEESGPRVWWFTRGC